jgi:hypothetical protein
MLGSLISQIRAELIPDPTRYVVGRKKLPILWPKCWASPSDCKRTQLHRLRTMAVDLSRLAFDQTNVRVARDFFIAATKLSRP